MCPIEPGALVGEDEAAEPGSPLPNASASFDVKYDGVSTYTIGNWPGHSAGPQTDNFRIVAVFDLSQIVFGASEEVTQAIFGCNISLVTDAAAQAWSILGYSTTGDETDPRDDTAANVYARCASGNVYKAALTDFRTTGVKAITLAGDVLTDINACINSGSKLFALAIKMDDETGPDTWAKVDAYDQASPPTLTLTVGVPAVNEPPIADAGPNQTVDEGDTVTLTGAASTDSDGTIASYSWTQIAGPTVALDTPNAVTCDFTAPEVSELTTMTFELTVTDNSGATNTDTVNIYVTDTTPPAVPTVGRSFRQLIA